MPTVSNSQVPVLLTTKQAAMALAISPRKLWGLTAGGEIVSLRIGRAVRYESSALSEFIEKIKRSGGPKP